MKMDIHEILKHLPHRYPIILVDRVLEIEKGRRIAALKNVSINEPVFMGHFPHYPVMPGVLIVEAMAQTAAILAFVSLDKPADRSAVYLFAGIDGARRRSWIRRRNSMPTSRWARMPSSGRRSG